MRESGVSGSLQAGSQIQLRCLQGLREAVLLSASGVTGGHPSIRNSLSDTMKQLSRPRPLWSLCHPPLTQQ